MTDFESLLAADLTVDANAEAYRAARAAKVAEIAEYIADYLKDGIDPTELAERLMTSAESAGNVFGDDVNGEIPSRYTKTGNPGHFSV